MPGRKFVFCEKRGFREGSRKFARKIVGMAGAPVLVESLNALGAALAVALLHSSVPYSRGQGTLGPRRQECDRLGAERAVS